MTDADLDQSYSAVCEALTRVGEAGAPMFLSMLCLSLMSRFERADQVLPLIENALAQSDAGQA
ncbi:hypothetical protein [Hydrogenophaga sp.]|uniref:hypothetical protein n=1 Tax=Hydrogenophaga sp. TaxID=1904254 RepID=UPI003F712036